MGITLRGCRDDPEVGQPATHAGVSNFVELRNVAVRQGNKDLEDHLKNSSNRETYISKTIFFSVFFYEASDSSNKEQLSISLRYVDENNDICEDFLKNIHSQSGLTGKDLYNEIISSLESFNLEIQNCRGQGYDGAGAVAGKANGLAALFLKENSKALYTHCASRHLFIL